MCHGLTLSTIAGGRLPQRGSAPHSASAASQPVPLCPAAWLLMRRGAARDAGHPLIHEAAAITARVLAQRLCQPLHLPDARARVAQVREEGQRAPVGGEQQRAQGCQALDRLAQGRERGVGRAGAMVPVRWC